jgi:hypothetical protein
MCLVQQAHDAFLLSCALFLERRSWCRCVDAACERCELTWVGLGASLVCRLRRCSPGGSGGALCSGRAPRMVLKAWPLAARGTASARQAAMAAARRVPTFTVGDATGCDTAVTHAATRSPRTHCVSTLSAWTALDTDLCPVRLTCSGCGGLWQSDESSGGDNSGGGGHGAVDGHRQGVHAGAVGARWR